MSKAIVFMADGMEMCECLITVDILRRAGGDVTTASVMGRMSIESSHKVMIHADALAEDVDFASADMLVLPGGTVGTANLASKEIVKEQCMAFAGNSNKYLAAICAAPAILADLGLLEGRRATCHPGVEEDMAGAVLSHAYVAVDHNIITGKAMAATTEFALKLAELLQGREAAERVAMGICFGQGL